MTEPYRRPATGQARCRPARAVARLIFVGLIVVALAGFGLGKPFPGPITLIAQAAEAPPASGDAHPTESGHEAQQAAQSLPPQPTPGRARILVDPARKIKPVNPLIFGININRWVRTLFPGTPETMDKTANWPAIQRIKDSGVRILKFPGGLEADTYVWNDPANPQSDTDTDEMVSLARHVGAEPWIQVNTLVGASLAGEWVRYTNIVKGYGVKYWEIGDEVYGPWAKGHTSPEEYGRKVVEYARAMKAVDPSIQIVASAVAGTGFGDWTRRLLRTAAGSIDALTFSFFPLEPGAETDERLLATPARLENAVEWLRSAMAQIVPEHAARIRLFVGGWNSLTLDPGPQSLQMVSAVWVADMLGNMLHLPLDGAAYWALQSTGGEREGDLGYLSSTADAAPRFPYWVFHMYARFFGTQLVATTSDDPRIRVYASTGGGADSTISLISVNTSADAHVPIEIRLASSVPGNVRAYLLDAEHLVTQVQHATATNLTMPPYSVMAIVVESR